MEALAIVNQFGICELREEELLNVDGGIDWGVIGVGIGAVALGAAIAATAGLATLPVAVLWELEQLVKFLLQQVLVERL